MRVLQIIDTLRPGGAERMAVSYANLLHKKDQGSYLCCTRGEGELKDQLNIGIEYLFLDKRSPLDINAFKKLREFIIDNKIDIIHAHSSSFFLASLIKLSGISSKLVWHDHYGESELLENRKFTILKFFSWYFDGIIAVNQKLSDWASKNLKSEKVTFINNFVDNSHNQMPHCTLNGDDNSFKIICLANLRPQKDHFNLLRSFEMVSEKINASLHLIGHDPRTSYSKKILDHISNSKFKDQIFYYGTQTNILGYLKQADLGVLASRSEGLPVALLEYGLAGLAVIVTNVGECSKVVNRYALVVHPENSEMLANSIFYYYKNENIRLEDAIKFKNHVVSQYGEDPIYNQIINFYSSL